MTDLNDSAPAGAAGRGPAPWAQPSRRTALVLGAGAAAGLTLGTALVPAIATADNDMTGALPALDFTMTRASDGKTVTAQDYRGKVVLLYFGYTFCPDVCPATLINLTSVLKRLGPLADQVRLLFVTVDPERDTLKNLHQYTDAFAPQTVGLRGTDNQLAALAKRYRVAYSVSPATDGHPYQVSHGSAVYVFDRSGTFRTLLSGLATQQVDLDQVAKTMRGVIAPESQLSWWQRILRWL